MYLTTDQFNQLGERYFNVNIYRYDYEDVFVSFLTYGSIEAVVDGMETWLIKNDADGDDFHASIDLDGIDLAYMDNLSEPYYESFDVDEDRFAELMA